jgi:hypothetical protein
MEPFSPKTRRLRWYRLVPPSEVPVDMPLSWLRDRGHDAVHAAEIGLDHAPESAPLSRAARACDEDGRPAHIMPPPLFFFIMPFFFLIIICFLVMRACTTFASPATA